ncbi:MAG: sulfatase-like hydrolase/transferase [Bacteroidota bacterium]
MKNQFLLYCFFLCLLGACADGEQKDTPPEKPNIVFIFTDDQTYSSVAALGNSTVQTPNMDRLVQNGTTFTHAYNMGGWNGAVCVASRSMIMSGRSVWRANQFKQNWAKRDSTALAQTWGKLMERQGYDTYMMGKWHINAPAERVFQQVKHTLPGMPRDRWNHQEMQRMFKEEVDGVNVKYEDIMPIGYNRPKDENDNTWSPSDTTHGGFWKNGKHWSEILRDDALGYIETAKTKDNPFFMYLSFNAPHDPRQAPQEYVDMYPLDKISLPKSWQPEYPDQLDIGNGPTLRDEALAPFPRTEYATKKHIQEYYAIITHLDAQIGMILDALEASGKMENTVVIFTADHGLAIGAHGLLGKQNLYDHSIRVPLVIMGKDIPKGKKVDTDIYLQDAMATSLELAGIKKPDYMEFHSLVNLIEGKTDEGNYPGIYGAYRNLQRMIRKDGFKLIVYPTIRKIKLFDLENDPDEIENLAEQETYQSKVKLLMQDLLALQKEMDDPLDLTFMLEKI